MKTFHPVFKPMEETPEMVNKKQQRPSPTNEIHNQADKENSSVAEVVAVVKRKVENIQVKSVVPIIKPLIINNSDASKRMKNQAKLSFFNEITN